MPDRLEETVMEFIRRHGLFAGAGRILLAVSGGADSVALLHLLMALKTRGWIEADFVCAHVNHQLRGPASNADEQFVIEQANRLGLPVVTKAVDVRAHAKMHKLSLETAGRQLRLATLGAIARSQGCTWVCTGHQKNDNAETVLHRLWRGTGFRGLAGIRPQRRLDDLRLASPLLCATRREIVQYLQERGLRWQEDQTNADVTYTRNYIRHRLLPLLQEEAHDQRSMGVPPVKAGPRWPCDSWARCPCHLVEELSELAASAKKLCDRVEREAEEAWSRLVAPAAGEVVIHAPGLAALAEPVAVELIRKAVVSPAIGGGNLTEFHYRGILRLAQKSVSARSLALPGRLVVRREGERIILSSAPPAKARRVGRVPKREVSRLGSPLAPPDAASKALEIPGQTRFAGHEIEARVLQRSEFDAARIGGDKGPRSEYLDLDQVKLPVVVRARQAGDRFQPLGMSGEKKVGKFLTTAKAPQDLREQILIFADRERIIWVCPVRISERVKVTEGTQRVLQLTISSL